MALQPPINPFADTNNPDPLGLVSSPGGVDSLRLPLPNVNKPQDLAPPSAFSPITAPAAPAPQGGKAFQYLVPALAGFGSGSSVQPTTSAPSAVMQGVGAGIGGAASGAALGTAIAPGVGTAVGAGVGGLVGLVSGGIQSYFGLKDARAQKREMNKRIKEIQEKEQERFDYEKQQNALARSDAKEQQGYDRRRNALASQWAAFQSVMGILNKGMQDDENIKSLFLQRGR